MAAFEIESSELRAPTRNYISVLRNYVASFDRACKLQMPIHTFIDRRSGKEISFLSYTPCSR